MHRRERRKHQLAGDWIPIRTDLHETREVILISARTGRDRHYVVGVLVRFWSWFSNQTATGYLRGFKVDDLPKIIGGSKVFWKAVLDSDWLREDFKGLSIPKPDRWLSRGAKSRLMDTTRKQAARAKSKGSSGKHPHKRRTAPGQKPDVTGTTGEERIEESNTPLSPPRGGSPQALRRRRPTRSQLVAQVGARPPAVTFEPEGWRERVQEKFEEVVGQYRDAAELTEAQEEIVKHVGALIRAATTYAEFSECVGAVQDLSDETIEKLKKAAEMP